MARFEDIVAQVKDLGIHFYACDEFGYVAPNQGIIGKDNVFANREGTPIKKGESVIWRGDGYEIKVYSDIDVTFVVRENGRGKKDSFWVKEGGRVNFGLLGLKEAATA